MVKILDGVDFAGSKGTNVAAGTNPNDLVILSQVQSLLAGLDPKQSVKVKTTAQTTLSGLTAVNGYTPSAGDRILVTANTNAAENGIYAAATGPWTRTLDGSQGNLTAGALVAVEQGTADADTLWLLTSDDPLTVGTTAQTWSKWGAGLAYTAGNGVSIISGIISLITGAGLILDGTSLRLDPGSTVFARHRSYAVPAGTNPSVTHDLNTTAISAQLWDISGAAPVLVGAGLQATDTTHVLVPTTAATGQYRLDLIG